MVETVGLEEMGETARAAKIPRLALPVDVAATVRMEEEAVGAPTLAT